MCMERKQTIPTSQGSNQDGRIRFRQHCLRSGNNAVFEGTSSRISLDNCDQRGSFLCMELPKQAGVHGIGLGKLKCSRFVATSRQQWWMHPRWGHTSKDIPSETQLLLARLSPPSNAANDFEEEYVVVLPLLSESFRSFLEGDPHGNLILKIDCTDHAVLKHTVENVALIAHGDDPIRLIHTSLDAVATHLKTFTLREQKSLPQDLDLFGWCTRAAHSPAVDGAGIVRGIEKLSAGGVPPRSIVIGEGWQDSRGYEETSRQANLLPSLTAVTPAKNSQVAQALNAARARIWSWSAAFIAKSAAWYYATFVQGSSSDSVQSWIWKTLSDTLGLRHDAICFQWPKSMRSTHASPRFLSSVQDRSFSGFVRRLKDQRGVRSVYCWHALLGYWSAAPLALCGATSAQPQAPGAQRERLQDGLRREGKAAIQDMFSSLHAELAACGVDGVTVSAQAEATLFGSGKGGSVSATRAIVGAMESSVVRHFGGGGHCINDMCHPTECLYSYKDTAVAKATEEGEDARAQITSAAFNSLLLGEIAQPDWGPFKSTGPSALMQAAARAVAGCAVTVSDGPDEHDFELLRRVVLPDGTLLRATLPGRPTRDSLLTDVTRDGESALKVWNRNLCNGVVAAFNVQGCAWDDARHRYVEHCRHPAAVRVCVSVDDVEGMSSARMGGGREWAMRSTKWSAGGRVVAGCVEVGGAELGASAEVGAGEVLLATVAAVHEGRSYCGKLARWATLGLEEMLNGGGAVVEERDRHDAKSGWRVDAEVTVRGHGTLLTWCERGPTEVRVLGASWSVQFRYDDDTRLLRVPVALSASQDVAVFRIRF